MSESNSIEVCEMRREATLVVLWEQDNGHTVAQQSSPQVGAVAMGQLPILVALQGTTQHTVDT